MAVRKLITPQCRVQIGTRTFTNGISTECYSSLKERCSWATVEYGSGYAGLLAFSEMAPAKIELGYDGDYDTLLTGYVVSGKALGPFKILDDTIFLMRTYVTETFIGCRPQDIIRYGLGKAGITNYIMADTVYPKRDVVSISRKNVVELIQEVERVWGIRTAFYFKNGCFYWGTKETQKLIYVLEEGKNILSCTRFNKELEIKTIGVPWIHQGEQILVKHRRFTGEVTVSAARVKADEEGCVRMFLTFEEDG